MTGIGDVLQTARRARGMTQAELAHAAGVSQAALSRYEHDLREPEPEVLPQLADALGVTAELLMHGGRMEGGIAVGAHMRRRATAKPTVWRTLEAQLNMTRLHASRLFEEVSMTAQLQVPTFDPIDTSPADAARLVRLQWRMPVGPVHSLATWMEAAGILIVEEDFGQSVRVDGLSQWSGEHPVVLVNATAPTDRKRWTLAHELGHIVLHSEHVDDEAEDQANAFAAELLMPAVEIKTSLANLAVGRLVDLKKYWGVSMAALVERAIALGMKPARERAAFYKMMSARGYRTNEPGSAELTPERPTLTTHIAQILSQRGLTDVEIANVAGFKSVKENKIFVRNEARGSLRLL